MCKGILFRSKIKQIQIGMKSVSSWGRQWRRQTPVQKKILLHAEKDLPSSTIGLQPLTRRPFSIQGKHVHVGSVIATPPEFHGTIDQGIQRMIFSDSHIFTRVMFCSSLPDDDVSGPCKLTTIYFHA
jgi:hypothetical protein